MGLGYCCRVCVVIQLIVMTTLSFGAILILGAIELNANGWEASSDFLKFSCLIAAILLVNIFASGIFYFIVWKRRSRQDRESIDLQRPQDVYSIQSVG